MSVSQLVVLVLLLVQQYHTGSCWYTPSPPGSLDSPYDLFYVGENLTLHCHKETSFIGTPEFEHGNVPVSQDYVTVVNATYARLDKPVTSQDAAETTYYCFDNDSTIGTLGSIYTDYPPQNATDLELIWWNKQKMFASWRFGNTTYKNSHTEDVIVVTAQWSMDTDQETQSWNACDEASITTCNSSTNNEWADVTIRVNITNVKRGQSAITTFPRLPIRDYVKPSRVQSMDLKALSSRAVEVTVKSEWPQQEYHITYCTMVNAVSNCSTWTSEQTQQTRFEICCLHPHYSYTFGVQSRFRKGYLSDVLGNDLRHTITMPQDAPSSGPGITPGSFYMDHTTCSQTQQKTAKIYIYFQDVPEEDQNGVIRNYTAEVTVDDRSKTFSQSGSVRTIMLDQMPCQQGFEVSLYASTDVGPSPATSLTLPDWNQTFYSSMEELDLKIKVVGNGSVTAEWDTKPQALSEINSLLVYFCEKDPTNNDQCQNTIQHKEVSAMWGQYPLISANANMKFGVAAVSQTGMTTGILFTECLYDPDRVEDVSPSNIQFTRQSDGTLVTWTGAPRCIASRRVVILGYNIRVCTLPQNVECFSLRVTGNSNSHMLTKLQTDRDYNISVGVVTTSTQSASVPVTAVLTRPKETEQGGLGVGPVVGVVSAVLVIVIIVALIYYCRDKISRQKRSFTSKIDFRAPQIPAVDVEGLSSDNGGDVSTTTTTTNNNNNDNNNNSIRDSTLPVQQQSSDDSGYAEQTQDSHPDTPSTNTQVLTTPETPEQVPTMNAAAEGDPHCVYGQETPVLEAGVEDAAKLSTVPPYVCVTGGSSSHSSDVTLNTVPRSQNTQVVAFVTADCSVPADFHPPPPMNSDTGCEQHNAGDGCRQGPVMGYVQTTFSGSEGNAPVESCVTLNGSSQTIPKIPECPVDSSTDCENSTSPKELGLLGYVKFTPAETAAVAEAQQSTDTDVTGTPFPQGAVKNGSLGYLSRPVELSGPQVAPIASLDEKEGMNDLDDVEDIKFNITIAGGTSAESSSDPTNLETDSQQGSQLHQDISGNGYIPHTPKILKYPVDSSKDCDKNFSPLKEQDLSDCTKFAAAPETAAVAEAQQSTDTDVTRTPFPQGAVKNGSLGYLSRPVELSGPQFAPIASLDEKEERSDVGDVENIGTTFVEDANDESLSAHKHLETDSHQASSLGGGIPGNGAPCAAVPNHEKMYNAACKQYDKTSHEAQLNAAYISVSSISPASERQSSQEAHHNAACISVNSIPPASEGQSSQEAHLNAAYISVSSVPPASERQQSSHEAHLNAAYIPVSSVPPASERQSSHEAHLNAAYIPVSSVPPASERQSSHEAHLNAAYIPHNSALPALERQSCPDTVQHLEGVCCPSNRAAGEDYGCAAKPVSPYVDQRCLLATDATQGGHDESSNEAQSDHGDNTNIAKPGNKDRGHQTVPVGTPSQEDRGHQTVPVGTPSQEDRGHQTVSVGTPSQVTVSPTAASGYILWRNTGQQQIKSTLHNTGEGESR